MHPVSRVRETTALFLHTSSKIREIIIIVTIRTMINMISNATYLRHFILEKSLFNSLFTTYIYTKFQHYIDLTEKHKILIWCNYQHVDRGLNYWPGQTKDHYIGIYWSSPQHTSLRSTSKGWLRVRKMCLRQDTCLSADCCFSVLRQDTCLSADCCFSVLKLQKSN